MKNKTSLKFADMPSTYDELVANIYIPRPIHDGVDYANVMEIVLAMAGHDLNQDQEDYLDAISTMIEKYDAENRRDEIKNVPVVRRLRDLLETANMNPSDLGRILGNRTLGYKIVSGERELSKANILTLAKHFKLSPEYFL